ncbi:hypothetical protein GCM10009069_22630 [Algimonas arctica]|uniref:Uncharacterized protein n=1 Tax=Algimonas arctica TaxID=1479486 RepID=A0A8J3G348_9PROT|nr:hypothetical protein GCM10009069_22630 [Algimonas arctica]
MVGVREIKVWDPEFYRGGCHGQLCAGRVGRVDASNPGHSILLCPLSANNSGKDDIEDYIPNIILAVPSLICY